MSLNVAICREWYFSASSAFISAVGRYASSRGPTQPLITTLFAAALVSEQRKAREGRELEPAVEDQDGLDPAVRDTRGPAELRQRLHPVTLKGELWELGVVMWGTVG